MTTSQSSISIAENGAQQQQQPPPEGRAVQRALVWLGIAGASATLTFLIVRATMRRTPADPTSVRIQSLIDEANRLLRTLDEQKHD